MADRGYDTNEIVTFAPENGMQLVIPSKRNRKKQRCYDKELYKKRHIVENTFRLLKGWRGIATRYAKLEQSFLYAVVIKAIFIRANRIANLM